MTNEGPNAIFQKKKNQKWKTEIKKMKLKKNFKLCTDFENKSSLGHHSWCKELIDILTMCPKPNEKNKIKMESPMRDGFLMI